MQKTNELIALKLQWASSSRLVACIVLLGLLSSCSTPGESDYKGMIRIPGGSFTMGGRSAQASEDEFPRHNVKVSAFYMDAYEVSNLEFAEFVQATGYITTAEKNIDWEVLRLELPPGTPKPPDSVLKAGSLVFESLERPVDLNHYWEWWSWTTGADWRHPEGPGSSIEDRMDHPVVHVSWEDANAYAQWKGKRLPSEAEWEWASSGGRQDFKYPWGNKPIDEAYSNANFWQGVFPNQNLELDGFYATAPVGSYPANPYGLFDMAGNVWEWCLDKYDVNGYSKDAEKGVAIDPEGSADYYDPREPYSEKHVIRGGSFLCNESYCSGYRISRRMSSSKDSGFNHTGFRCVKDL